MTDIDKLTEAQLVDLNKQILLRLKFLRNVKVQAQMTNFNIGEIVTFRPDAQAEFKGIIAKCNRKTVAVITENGQHWNVAPDMLTKVT